MKLQEPAISKLLVDNIRAESEPRNTHERHWLRKCIDVVAGLPAPVRMGGSLLIMLAIGWLDAATGWEVSLFVFYAVPITAAVWIGGLRAGVVFALLGGTIWWFANRDENPYVTQWGYTWAMVNRLAYFGFVVFGVRAIQVKQQSDAAQIAMLEEMRTLEKEIISVSEHEQQRIGQDLHDGLCQQLAAIGCAARILADELAETVHPGQEDAANIESAIKSAVVEARSLARGIFPVHVDRSGLAAALGELAESTSRLTGLRVEFVEGESSIVANPDAAMHLFRIAQEAVANAVKHAGASTIKITLQEDDGEIALRTVDDGRGIRPKLESQKGMGLKTMLHRARVLHGQLFVNPLPSGGTEVICAVKTNACSDERKES